jgi:hypothetical protein
MNDRLHKALLDMADPAKKLAEALEEYQANLGMGRNDINAADIQELFDIKNSPAYTARTVIDPAHANLVTGMPKEIAAEFIDRTTMEILQSKADELLHAIDLAGQNVKSAIALQTLDLVRVKVKDVVANIAGTIEKDL